MACLFIYKQFKLQNIEMGALRNIKMAVPSKLGRELTSLIFHTSMMLLYK